MYRSGRILGTSAALVLLLLGIFVALSGTSGVLGAAKPGVAQAAITAKEARLHRLSGVVSVPPWKVKAEAAIQALGGDLGKPLKDALNAPLFGPNIDASLNNPAVQNETTVAINPENSQNIIASGNDYRAGLQPWVYLSTNGGTNWTNYQVPGTGSLFYGDPAMDFGTGGHAYFSYLGYTSVCAGIGGMFISRSTDAGATFSAPIQLAQNYHDAGGDYFQDKEYVAVDRVPGSPNNGNVYVAWTKFIAVPGCSSYTAAPIVLSRSTDDGVTWSQPITASMPISNNNQAAQPVIGRHGEVYLYYVGAQTLTQPGYDTVLFSRSTDGGQTFPFFTHIASMTDLPSPLPNSSFRVWGAGAMAADQIIDGRLYAVWADYGTGDADIMMSRSTDNGNTWGAPQRVNDDAVGNDKDQFFPWIATSPDGTVHISWFDRREDPNNANYKAYYTYSTDHGATFAANIAVSTAPSVPSGSSFIGDYSGLAATDGAVIPIWTDIRTAGNQNAYIAVGQYPPSGGTATPTQTPGGGTNTPTLIPSTTPTATYTTLPCDPTASTHDVTAECDSEGTYSYSFYVQLNTCPSAEGSGVVVLQGSATQGDPWTQLDQQSFGGTFQNGDNLITGAFTDTVVPEQYQWWRIIIFGGVGPNHHKFYGQTSPAPVCAPCDITFSDVNPSDYFYEAVQYLACQGVISGYADGTFRPYNNTTRGQLCKIIALARGWTIECPTEPHFSDVPATDPFYCYIETAYLNGVVVGYSDGTFRPYNNVTRAQLSKIVVVAMGWNVHCPAVGHFTDVPSNDPFYCFIETAYERGIVTGYADGTFRPGNNATRGQISKIVHQALGSP